MGGGFCRRSCGIFLSHLLGVWPEGSARAQEAPADAPFALETLRVPGRALEAWPARFDLSRRDRSLVVVAVEGSPPDEIRRLCVFSREPGGAFEREPGRVLELEPDVVAFDVAPTARGGPDAVVVL